MTRNGEHCIEPGAVPAEALMAYVDGEAPAPVAAHVRQCPYCSAEASRVAQAQRRLQRALYRFDCPTPHTLGEYVLSALTADQHAEVAAHVFDCPRCSDELQTLRSFLSVEPEPQPGAVERLRRLVATLVAPPRGAAAYAGLRGSDEAASQTYQADGVTITIGVEPEPREGRVTLTGLVVHQSAADVLGGEAQLVGTSGEARSAPIDDLGNFVFEAVISGAYHMELRLAAQIVAIENMQIGGE